MFIASQIFSPASNESKFDSKTNWTKSLLLLRVETVLVIVSVLNVIHGVNGESGTLLEASLE